ncbi:flagellar hook-length control protein FliK [Marinobacter sp. DY40_1A1]|uniref:flagellar hook-length control protein FliK n=1 Tax=Marinobacter sp. DY40_1A1 TaxID=2583229 RepID=UPI00190699B4|nr:flagellar hook-length control protein FliK [Marinobacter sp. DY40_1A1]MBK1885520.1 flagellar hook-length control protein FliK [Marinobacter sp. DY40_1A1]
MTQMVLPQTPAPGMQNDAGASKAGSARDSVGGESRYDSVSRTEQKRLDRQQAQRNDDNKQTEARNARKADSEPTANQAQPSGKPGAPAKADKTAAADETAVAGMSVDGANAEIAPEMEALAIPLTFAELQALLVPTTGQAAVAGGLPANNPAAVAPGAQLFAGLAGVKPEQTATQLSDSVMPLAGKSASSIDPSALLTGTRFESAVELVSQQNANNAAGKLAADAQVPLRSYATSVDVPVNHAEWGDKLMGKLSWLTAKNLSVAEIHLTPPDMGPMEVRVRVQNDQANITVHAANPVVREQLELHSHRLRDMLGEQGLSLAQFDVSDNSRNSSGEQNTGDGDGSSTGSGTTLSAAESGDEGGQAGSLDLNWNGAIDVFA